MMVDGLKGFPEAISSVFPETVTSVRTALDLPGDLRPGWYLETLAAIVPELALGISSE